jgi:RNA-directed DNA polymerase
MNKRPSPFDLLCDPERLMSAWKRVRANRGAPGIDQVSITEFETNLQANLADIASRLREGRYYPMPTRIVEMRKANGGIRQLGILTVEDRIVQRAALDVIEPLFEPAFLDCSYGFRPNRSVEMAVERVLDYRRAGDLYVVNADISDCFGSLDHELLMQFVRKRIKDKRLLGLIRMWLDTGQVLPRTAEVSGQAGGARVLERVVDYMSHSFDAAIGHLLDERGYSGIGYGGYGDFGAPSLYGSEGHDEVRRADEQAADPRRLARKEALKRLGRDGALLLLTYSGRARRLLSPKALALTGAAALATTAIPRAARLVRGRLSAKPVNVGAVQGGALSPMLSNIYLHEFDVAMMKAGLHLVRYADDFVILCHDERTARKALDTASRKLTDLRLRLNPQKTHVMRFDAGLEFLGYRFDAKTAAAPAPMKAPRLSGTLHVFSEASEHAARKIVPALASRTRSAAEYAGKGASRLAEGIKRWRRRRSDEHQ